MKNNRMKDALNRELQEVRVGSELKKRILTEATASRMPQRRKAMSVMPLAAAAAVILMIGLATGVTMLRAEKPDLSATPLSAATAEPEKKAVYVSDGDGLYHWQADCGGMTEAHAVEPEKARAEGRKACSECLGEGENGADALVWMTNFGNYYHEQHDCSGMTGAVGVLEIEAKTLGRQVCPVCMGGEAVATLVPKPMPAVMPASSPMPTAMPMPGSQRVQEAMPTAVAESEKAKGSSVVAVVNESGDISFWMTKSGVYYHIDEHCSGMEGAHICTEEEAMKAGKILCMVCMPEETSSEVSRVGGLDGPTAIFVTEERSVWMTDNGAYYHSDEHCSGMEDAYVSDESAAAENGKFPCPVCLPDSYAEEVQFVWMTKNGVYYHTDEHCSGMESEYGCEVLEALANGKTPCPKCAKQLSSVWVTENGMYYHLNPDCSGMTGAEEIPGRDAVMQGKTICPNCRKEIAEAAIAAAKRYAR